MLKSKKFISLFIFLILTTVPILLLTLNLTKAEESLEFGDMVTLENQEYKYIGEIKGEKYFMNGIEENPYTYKLNFYKMDTVDSVKSLEHGTVYADGSVRGYDQHIVNITLTEDRIFFLGKQDVNECVSVFNLDLSGNLSGPLSECIRTQVDVGRLYGVTESIFLINKLDDKYEISNINRGGEVSTLYSTTNRISAEYFMYDEVNTGTDGIYFREYDTPDESERIIYIDSEGNTKTIKEFETYNYMMIFFQKRGSYFSVGMDKTVKILTIYSLDEGGATELLSTSNTSIGNIRQDITFRNNELYYRNELIHAITQETESTQNTSDISGNVFERYIQNLLNDGVVELSEDENYYPDEAITRIDLAEMLVKAFGFEIDTSGVPFPDASDMNHEPYAYIQTLKNLKIINGYTDGKFKPNEPVSRDMSTKFFTRSLEKAGLAVNYTYTPDSCRAYYDGCNTCTKLEGGKTTCTKMLCVQNQTPYCLDKDTPLGFVDVGFDNKFFAEILYLSNVDVNEEKIIKGTGNQMFSPSELLSRGAAAKITDNSRNVVGQILY